MSEESRRTVAPNRPVIVVLTTATMMLGLSPAALALHRLWLLPYLLTGTLLAAVLAARGRRIPSHTRPSVLELLLAALSNTGLTAFLGLIWLLLYYTTYGIIRLVNRISGVHGNAVFIALAASLTVVAVFGVIVAWFTTRDLISTLFPPRGGARTVYYPIAAKPRSGLALAVSFGLLVAAAVGVAALTSSWLSTVLWVLILIFIIAAAGTVVAPTLPPSLQRAGAEVVQTVSDALTATGYSVVPYPQTGEPDIDPLLSQLDLFAYRTEEAFAVVVKHASTNTEPLDWRIGSNVLTAARLLGGGELSETSADIYPLVVLLGVPPDESLLAFCKSEGVYLLYIEPSGHTTTVGGDKSELQAIADRYLKSLARQEEAEGASARRRRTRAR
jgi:hypothetical protein